MQKIFVVSAAILFSIVSLSSVVAADGIPGGPGKPPVFVKFFEKMYAGDPPIELVRNGPVYLVATCPTAAPGLNPRILGKTDLEGTLAKCTNDPFTTRWFPDGSGNPAAFLDPGDTCVIHNQTNEADPFINVDDLGGLLVAPSGEVIQVPASTTGVAVDVLDADCVFIGVATLFTGNP